MVPVKEEVVDVAAIARQSFVPTGDRLMHQSADELPLVTIESRLGWSLIDLKELWRYRELLYSLTWRDINVRYKQTVLGAAWAILQPLATMVVFSLFFGRIGKLPSGSLPYPIFVLAGLLPWFFFANALSAASQSVVGNQNLITKIYFPRLLIPMGAVAAGLVDFAVSLVLLIIMMLFYGVWPSTQVFFLPIVIGGLIAVSLGVGVLMSALTVAYRDFRHIVPFMVQLWMFMTPAIYMNGGKSFGPRLQAVLPLNPLYGLIVNFRAAVLGEQIDAYSLCVSGGISLALLLLGCGYFRLVERNFADVI